MLDATKLRRNSKKSSEITFQTKKATPIEKRVNPYAPFVGVDGKDYIIGYDKRFHTTTNCYAFAMGWQLPAQNKYMDYIPGFLTGQPFTTGKSAELVKSDLEAVGRKVYEILYDVPEKLPDGDGYWIKCLQCEEKGLEGLHFARKDKKSGRWIHKVGWEMPPKVYVRNVEFRDKLEVLFELPEMKTVPREVAEPLIKQLFLPHMYNGKVLERSEVETDDSAHYLAFDENDELFEYQIMWVMRVSEP